MDPARAAVLLDIDGTLVDSTYHHAVAWHRAFARHDLTPPLWRIHRTVGMGGDKLVGQVAGDEVEERLGDELRTAWQEEYAELRAEVRPLPGAAELVHELADTGYRVALASSGEEQFSREAVDLLGVGDRVELMVSSGDVDASKPAPDLVEETLSRLDGVTHAAFVGDTVYDVESSAKAGVPCLALLCGGYGRAELEEAGAALVVETPADLLGLDWAEQLRPVG